MILKLEAAKRALAGGVQQVRIVGGANPRALRSVTNRTRATGTRVLPMPVAKERKFAAQAAR
jgi:acetylglutamate kinase